MCYVYGIRHSCVCEGTGDPAGSVKELGSVPAKVEPSDHSPGAYFKHKEDPSSRPEIQL